MDLIRTEAAARAEARKERLKHEDVRMTRVLTNHLFEHTGKLVPVIYQASFDRICVLSMPRLFTQMAIPQTNLSLLHNDSILMAPPCDPTEPVFIGFTVTRAREFCEHKRIMDGLAVNLFKVVDAVSAHYHDARLVTKYCREILEKVFDAGDPFDSHLKDSRIMLA